jgi:undecaprenyl pyrophosphate synthase
LSIWSTILDTSMDTVSTNNLALIENFFLKFPRDTTNFPETVAIFPDGNRRNGQENDISRSASIKVGVGKLFEVVTVLKALKGKNLFILLCNKANFGRKTEEIEELLDIIVTGLTSQIDFFNDIDSYVHFVGNLTVMSDIQSSALYELQSKLNHNARLQIYLGINYDSKLDLFLSGGAVSDLHFPHPVDLAIRTGYSNVVPELATLGVSPNATLVFPQCLWPEYTVSRLLEDMTTYFENQRAPEDVF